MEDKQGFVSELKEDAKKAWNYIKESATKIGTYALLTLSLTGISQEENQKLDNIKENYQASIVKNDLLKEKLNNKSDKTTNTQTAHLEDYLNPFVEKTPEEKAEITYQRLNQGAVVPKEFSIEELMEQTGITKEDIQQVLSENKERIQDLTPGKRAQNLAKAADRVSGKNNSNCLYGAQLIFQNAKLGSILTGENPDWPDKLKGCPYNSACNADIPLEKSGKFLNITLENTAYNKTRTSAENQNLQAFCRKLPPGVIIITDNKVPDEDLGRRYKDLERMYGKGGKIHGHIAIKDNHGLYKEEGVALAPSFNQYGQDFKISLSTDYQVPEDLAKMFIAQKEKRLSKEKEHEKYPNKVLTSFNLKQLNGAEHG